MSFFDGMTKTETDVIATLLGIGVVVFIVACIAAFVAFPFLLPVVAALVIAGFIVGRYLSWYL